MHDQAWNQPQPDWDWRGPLLPQSDSTTKRGAILLQKTTPQDKRGPHYPQPDRTTKRGARLLQETTLLDGYKRSSEAAPHKEQA